MEKRPLIYNINTTPPFFIVHARPLGIIDSNLPGTRSSIQNMLCEIARKKQKQGEWRWFKQIKIYDDSDNKNIRM